MHMYCLWTFLCFSSSFLCNIFIKFDWWHRNHFKRVGSWLAYPSISAVVVAACCIYTFEILLLANNEHFTSRTWRFVRNSYIIVLRRTRLVHYVHSVTTTTSFRPCYVNSCCRIYAIIRFVEYTYNMFRIHGRTRCLFGKAKCITFLQNWFCVSLCTNKNKQVIANMKWNCWNCSYMV